MHFKGSSACDSPAAKVLSDQCGREKLTDTLCKWRQQGQSPGELRTGNEKGKRSFGEALSRHQKLLSFSMFKAIGVHLVFNWNEKSNVIFACHCFVTLAI